MKPDPTRPQVTLEQLLRVKRAERPPSEFWQHFEHEIRVKQLAAIVEPRPWWAPFIRVGARVTRYQVPVGATAIFALTLLTVREYQMPAASEAQFEPAIEERVVHTMPGPAVTVVLPPAATVESPVKETGVTQVAASSAQASAQAFTSDRALGTVPMLGGTGREADSPTARMIAANLEAVKNSAPELAQLINRVSGIDELIAPQHKTEVIDPLARVSVHPDRRSSRLLAGGLSVASYASSEISPDTNTGRLSRSLTEERLYDSVSRFGFNANRVAIKF